MLFAETPVDPLAGWAAAIAALAVTVGLIAQIVLQVLAKWEAAKTAAKAQEAITQAILASHKAKIKTEEVKQDLQVATDKTDGKLADLAKIARETNVYINGGMTARLELTQLLAHRLADLKLDPRDVAVATEADEAVKIQKEGRLPGGPA